MVAAIVALAAGRADTTDRADTTGRPDTAGRADAAAAAPGTPIASAEIRAAAEKLAADPKLGHERKIRSLRWKQSQTPDPPRPSEPPAWIVGLFEYLGQTGSVLLWVLGAIAAAISTVWIYRTVKARDPVPMPIAPPAVTRIGDLDIRPESLPEDIGRAALELAERGRTRDALSLLYRGALSRAVHRYSVPIGDSHTEDEVLRAIGAVLDASRVSYVSELVAVWRRAVYAGRPVSVDPIRRLCQGFAAALDPAGT